MKKYLQHIIILFTLCISNLSVFSQTDTEFWFVAPEVTKDHYPGHSVDGIFYADGGEPILIRITSGDLPATVTFNMPAFEDLGLFTPVQHTLAANETFTWNLTAAAPNGLDIQDLVENTPHLVNTGWQAGPDCINNKGIHITATNPITAYYEVRTKNNCDLFALKGANALGDEFYVPFQTTGRNMADWYAVKGNSAIDIVAIEDGTEITITPANDVYYNGGTVTAGTPFTVTLNRAQTFSVLPAINADGWYGREASDHLGGTYIKVKDDKKIAVTKKDDSVQNPGGGCYDLVGDQLVPLEILGLEYIAMKGQLWGTIEKIFVVATKAGTNLEINGANVATGMTAGQTYTHTLGTTFAHVKANEKIIVLHMSGFGCEVGGAILPPTDKCTGSPKVAFTRSTGESFFFNLMVRDGAQDGFVLDGIKQNTATAGAIFNELSFTQVPEDPNWWVARIGPISTANIAAGTPHQIENTKDIFHIGIINGGSTGGCRFGYFSDFNEFKPKAFTAGTGSSFIRACFGEVVQLVASGGTKFKWEPEDYLSDPNISSPTASPPATQKYEVTVSGACGLTDKAAITVEMFPYVEANFTLDTVFGCSPLEVKIHDQSLGTKEYKWTFRDTSETTPFETRDWVYPTNVDNDTTFKFTFENNTTKLKKFEIKLVVRNINDCADTLKRTVIVYPKVTAGWEHSPDRQLCHHTEVTFTDTTKNATLWQWEFDDGSSSILQHPKHIFDNFGNGAVTRNVRLIGISEYQCRDTVEKPIIVHSYVKADFAIDEIIGCTPFNITVDNQAQGDIRNFFLDWGDGSPKETDKTPATFNHLYNTLTAADEPDTLRVKMTVWNEKGAQCEDTLSRQIVVIPPNITSIGLSDAGPVCDSTTISFTGSPGYDISYNWEFGKGGSSAVKDPNFIFTNPGDKDSTYQVILTTSSIKGYCEDKDTVDIIVHPRVLADFKLQYQSVCAPIKVDFLNNSYGGANYKWTFDYETLPDEIVNQVTPDDILGKDFDNTKPNASTFVDVQLIAESAAACKDTLERRLDIFPKVVAKIDVNGSALADCSPHTINFLDVSTPTTGLLKTWDFADGYTSPTETPRTLSNRTAADKDFDVILTAVNASGCISKDTVKVTVYPEVIADVKLDFPNGRCTPFDVRFTNTSLNGNNFDWNFGFDGKTKNTTDKTPFDFEFYNIDPENKQTYASLLTATDTRTGCTDDTTVNIEVYPKLIPDFTLDQDKGCAPLPVAFTNNSVPNNNLTYNWNFDDGVSSSEKTGINHSFKNLDPANTPKSYDVKLTITNAIGCDSSITKTIETYPQSVADFSFDFPEGKCTPFPVKITNTSINSTENEWIFGTLFTNYQTDNNTTITKKFDNPDLNKIIQDTIYLRTTNAWNCKDSTKKAIEIYPRLISDIAVTAPTDKGCSPHTALFENNSTGTEGNLSYVWNFKDGETESSDIKANTSHKFQNLTNTDNLYEVELIAKNDIGCKDTSKQTVTVYPQVVANFSFDYSDGNNCTPFSISINNSTINATKENIWSFSDFIAGTSIENSKNFQKQITNSFDNKILKDTIRLVAESNNGCIDSVKKPINVMPEVIAFFDVDKTEGCGPLNINFTNKTKGLGTSHEWGTYQWNFGDYTFSDENAPGNHKYINAEFYDSTYKATLTATNKFGCVHKYDTLITVYSKTEANFAIDKTEGCTPLKVTFTNNSIFDGISRWNFGNGKTFDGKTPPIHTFTNSNASVPIEDSVYTVELYVENKHGCSNRITKNVTTYPRTKPNFSVIQEECHPYNASFTNTTLDDNESSFRWYLGKYGSSVNESPSYLFNNFSYTEDSIFAVRMIATTKHGCDDEITKLITVHPKPLARFEVPTDMDCSPFEAELVNTSKGVNLDYNWQYDGINYNTTSKDIIYHTFTNEEEDLKLEGIELEVITEFGCTDEVTNFINIYPQVEAMFTMNDKDGCSPHLVDFTNNSKNADFYKWTFGDGQESIAEKPSHSYTNKQHYDSTYTVHLSAKSARGCSDETSKKVTVFPMPNAEFAIDSVLRTYPSATFNFTNKTNHATKGIWSFDWNFGDGIEENYTAEKFPHTYNWWAPNKKDNVYVVSLRATRGECTDYVEHPLTLLPGVPWIKIINNVIDGCVPFTATFDVDSTYVHKNGFSWSFDDGGTDTDFEPTYTWNTAGTYNVKLSATGDGGGIYDYATVTVHPSPIVDFKYDNDYVMLPKANVQFYNLSKLGKTYFWDFGDETSSRELEPLHEYKTQNLDGYEVKLVVTTEFNCKDSLTLGKIIVDGNGIVILPNAFVPSLSGPTGGKFDETVDAKNEVFHAVTQQVLELEMWIFNRWGEVLFHTKDMSQGWDGYYKGQLAPPGVYVWRVRGKFENGQPFEKAGNVTLIR